uniref:ABM domain-containing protein n=1 Tax=Mycena chlorophos TaxID=658473 RepID=A0ABQ0KW49_MYCCL|nr:predicted protein [Mycena chlorophos]
MPFDKTLTHALYNTATALPSKVALTKSFWGGGPWHAERAGQVVQWFVFQYGGPDSPEFGILASFPSEADRTAHYDDVLAGVVRKHREGLLEGKPLQAPANILSNNITSTTLPAVGVARFFQAKNGQTEAVREFLSKGILSALEADKDTRYWYAYEVPQGADVTTPWPEQQFAVFAFFDDVWARKRSLAGPVTQALGRSAEQLLEKFPQINTFTVMQGYVKQE